jgi:hypothetical protein
MHVSDVTGIIAQGDATQLLDGTATGYTYEFNDKPSDAIKLGNETNNAEIFFRGSDITDGADFGCKIYGYPLNGPAKLICDISGVISEGIMWNDLTDHLYADTLTRTDTHISTVVGADSGSDRIATVAFDTVGYGWLYSEFYDISAAGNCISGSINAYMRVF